MKSFYQAILFSLNYAFHFLSLSLSLFLSFSLLINFFIVVILFAILNYVTMYVQNYYRFDNAGKKTNNDEIKKRCKKGKYRASRKGSAL